MGNKTGRHGGEKRRDAPDPALGDELKAAEAAPADYEVAVFALGV